MNQQVINGTARPAWNPLAWRSGHSYSLVLIPGSEDKKTNALKIDYKQRRAYKSNKRSNSFQFIRNSSNEASFLRLPASVRAVGGVILLEFYYPVMRSPGAAEEIADA